MKKIFSYILILFLLAGCEQKERKIVVYCSNDYATLSNASTSYLAMKYYNNSKRFNIESPDNVSISVWNQLMEEFENYRVKEKIGDVRIPYLKFNFCVYNQIVFFEDEQPICFMCINDKDNLISFNDDVYDITESGLDSIRSMLHINCKYNVPKDDQLDVYYTRKEIKVIR